MDWYMVATVVGVLSAPAAIWFCVKALIGWPSYDLLIDKKIEANRFRYRDGMAVADAVTLDRLGRRRWEQAVSAQRRLRGSEVVVVSLTQGARVQQWRQG